MTENESMMREAAEPCKSPTRATELRVQLDVATTVPSWCSCWTEPAAKTQPKRRSRKAKRQQVLQAVGT